VHSYLILAYSADDDIALNVGFYYMANAGGRLLGTLLSGVVFQYWGFTGCLAGSAMLLLGAAALAPRDRVGTLDAAVVRASRAGRSAPCVGDSRYTNPCRWRILGIGGSTHGPAKPA
jgi:hypothetical protein